jgi:hypothetical protein
VVVNGVPGRSIRHARGLRQGDPVSPILFILAMQVLTLLFVKATEEDYLSRINGCSAMQRISIYADDVVLLIKPLPEDMVATKLILKIFGEASGLHINYRKSTATLIRGGELERKIVEVYLQCKVVPFPIKYLGLQLALRPLSKAEWSPCWILSLRLCQHGNEG